MQTRHGLASDSNPAHPAGMIQAERWKINIFNRIKCVGSPFCVPCAPPYAAYVLALSEAHSASGPALA